MDSIYLEEFVNLAETCNYQKTATNMNLSVSALSKHISKLEDELGVFLLDRTTRNVKLNRYGETFAQYAQQILNIEYQCATELADLQKKDSTQLVVGYIPIMTQYGIPEFISEFAQTHPEIELKMLEKMRAEDLFSEDKCDFVFTENTLPNSTSICSVDFASDRLVAVLPLNHPLAGEQEITAEQLRDEKFIVHGRSKKEPFRSALTFCRKAKQAGYTPNIVLVSGDMTTIIKLVHKGVGVSVMNRRAAPSYLSQSVSMVDLYPHEIFHIYCLYSRSAKPSPISEEFLRYVKENADV